VTVDWAAEAFRRPQSLPGCLENAADVTAWLSKKKIDAAREDESVSQAAAFRDIFGPLPFRPVTFNPTWPTRTVTQLAEAIYTERAFDRLVILADALEDAGCHDQNILAHCRQEAGVLVSGLGTGEAMKDEKHWCWLDMTTNLAMLCTSLLPTECY
jgi:hypothetical protein